MRWNYRHPNNEVELFAQYLENSINIITKENKPFIICGDINIDLIQSDNMKYKSYIDTNNILPTITLPTGITDHSATIIDHLNIFRLLQQLHNIIGGNLFLDTAYHLPNLPIISGERTYKCKTSFIREFNEKNLANFK